MKPYAAILASALIATLPLAAQTPVDPKSPIPGYPDGRGPKGPVALKIVSPAADEVVPLPPAVGGQPAPKGARVEVKVEVTNFETFKDEATGRGQYVQLVLDGRLLAPWHQVDKPWIFGALPKGSHTLAAFLQRPWGETLREPGAFAVATFHVGEKDAKPAFDPAQPTVTVTSPRGKISKADAAKLLLDFWVTGCKIGPQTDPEAYQILYQMDNKDQPRILTAWEPVWLENVPPGKHTFVVALFKGELLKTPFAVSYGAVEITDGEAPAAAPAGAPAAPPATPQGGAAAPAAPAEKAPTAG